jgi:hypothetical protein
VSDTHAYIQLIHFLNLLQVSVTLPILLVLFTSLILIHLKCKKIYIANKSQPIIYEALEAIMITVKHF